MLLALSQELMSLCPIVTRAGGKVAVATDGVTVDHTPPEMIEIGTENWTQYQQRDDVLNFAWDFQDPESGVGEYRCVVFQTFHVSCLLFLSFVCCLALAETAVSSGRCTSDISSLSSFLFSCARYICADVTDISCLLSFLAGVAGYCCLLADVPLIYLICCPFCLALPDTAVS